MATAPLITGGWTAGSILPKSVMATSVVGASSSRPTWGSTVTPAGSVMGSRAPAAAVAAANLAANAPQQSSVGAFNAIAQNNVTAANLMTTASTLNNSSLGSRKYTNPAAGLRTVPIAKSVYGGVAVPAFLTQAVSDLNSEQALRRSLQTEWNNKIFATAQQGGPDSYLWQEAVRAASVSPGAHVNFGQAVQNPMIGQAQQTASLAYQKQAQATAEAINRPAMLANQIATLNAKKAALGPNFFGQYTGSPQAAIDTQLQNLYQSQAGAVTVGAAAGRGQSGWTYPAMI